MIPDIEKIQSIKDNLFKRSIEAIDDYTKFDWHNYNGVIDTDKINSSQALAIDFWGCLKLSPYKNKIINDIFNKNCSNWKVIFEYANKALLSEITPTQIDVILESETFAIIIESKFSEANGGHCSQTKKTTYHPFQCNGNYEEQVNPVNGINSKCTLTGKKILYWDYIDNLTTFNKKANYSPCPFRKEEFQWIRNICFADAYGKYRNIATESYLVYYKSDKCPISRKVENQTYLGRLKGNIKNPKSFQPISYNDLLSIVISSLDSKNSDEQQIWIELQEWMKKKEREL